MDVRHLEYFLGIVDHGGFARAAEAMHIAQPSLSQAIRRLERDLGVELFHRLGRGVRLTGAGEQLVGPARRAVRSLQAARDAARSSRELTLGTVDICAMPSPGIEPLTTLIGMLRERHPGLDIRSAAAFTPEEVVASVAGGETEVGLLGAAGRPATADLGVITFAPQPLVLISPPGTHAPGGEVGTIGRRELSGIDVVISPRGSLMRQLVDDALAHGNDIRVVAEVSHRTSLLPLVLAGVGHSVMPSSWTRMAQLAGCTVRTIDPPTALQVHLVHRREDLTAAAAAFVALAKELSQDELAGDEAPNL
ncbi:LysR family transcriptional regulator [Brachybacterium aquaticum]|uniref:DNA-binding transcriptional LysR family regulator n=1 Tax=Brachybacterium aquaticum TaxID=1432564 RepID=A0A841ACU7_9MICO|nr:LysR family transcriptional regulator [Brachybacterium aquaticum]MBB5830984.1 DNA-binding transcriptional LysR family regulator [Brachybacterium aquaticum]